MENHLVRVVESHGESLGSSEIIRPVFLYSHHEEENVPSSYKQGDLVKLSREAKKRLQNENLMDPGSLKHPSKRRDYSERYSVQ